jgi:hypothetical protein
MAIAVLVLAACARDVHVRFPDATGNLNTAGTLVVLFTEPVSDVAITIDGILAVAGAHTQRVVIDHVPVGTDDIAIAANGGDKEMRVWIASDHVTTIPIGMPDAAKGLVNELIGAAATVVAYMLLR